MLNATKLSRFSAHFQTNELITEDTRTPKLVTARVEHATTRLETTTAGEPILERPVATHVVVRLPDRAISHQFAVVLAVIIAPGLLLPKLALRDTLGFARLEGALMPFHSISSGRTKRMSALASVWRLGQFCSWLRVQFFAWFAMRVSQFSPLGASSVPGCALSFYAGPRCEFPSFLLVLAP